METGDKTNQVVATQHVPGNICDNNSYRAEAMGLLAIVSLIEAVCNFRALTTGEIIIGCDGECALNVALHDKWDVRVSDKQHDVFQCLHEARSRLPPGIRLKKRWVKGHSDDKIPYARMTRTQQLNVDCDREAKALAAGTAPLDRPTSISGDAWELSVRGYRLVHDIESTIRKSVHDPNLLEKWNIDERLSETTHHLLDWTAQAKATKNTPRRRTIGITKLYSENCATNEKMVLWGFRSCEKCARCNHPVETVDHLLQCPDPDAIKTWDSSVDKLDVHLRKSGTQPYLRTLIIRRLKAWKRQQPWRLTGVPIEYRRLQDDQDAIGWKIFLFGFVAKDWGALQQTHYSHLNSRRSGAKWIRDLIPQMWEILWAQWMHRNSIVHSNHETTGAAPMDEIDEAIHAELALGEPARCPTHLRRYFRGPAARLLGKNALDRRLWLKTAQGVRHMVTDLLVDHDNLSAERRTMRRWLATLPP